MPDLFSILPEVQQAFNRVVPHVPHVGVCGNELGKRRCTFCAWCPRVAASKCRVKSAECRICFESVGLTGLGSGFRDILYNLIRHRWPRGLYFLHEFSYVGSPKLTTAESFPKNPPACRKREVDC